MELKRVCILQIFEFDEFPDCVQSASVDKLENYAKWQGRNPNTSSVLLKMDKMGEIVVVEVGDNKELGVICQKDEESFVDKNEKIFDTILLNKTIETAKGKLEEHKDQGSDTYGVFSSFVHFFSVN